MKQDIRRCPKSLSNVYERVDMQSIKRFLAVIVLMSAVYVYAEVSTNAFEQVETQLKELKRVAPASTEEKLELLYAEFLRYVDMEGDEDRLLRDTRDGFGQIVKRIPRYQAFASLDIAYKDIEKNLGHWLVGCKIKHYAAQVKALLPRKPRPDRTARINKIKRDLRKHLNTVQTIDTNFQTAIDQLRRQATVNVLDGVRKHLLTEFVNPLLGIGDKHKIRRLERQLPFPLDTALKKCFKETPLYKASQELKQEQEESESEEEWSE